MPEQEESSVDLPPSSLSHKELRMLCLDSDLSISGKKSVLVERLLDAGLSWEELGLEAIEGTDKLIIRCKELKKSGDKGILVKFSKYKQSTILDVPTIGEKTIKLLKENNYEGVYLEKNHCLILDKEKTIDLANKNNIFISTCNKIE